MEKAEEQTMTGRRTRKGFASDQEVRWCPGCGDYAIPNRHRRAQPIAVVWIISHELHTLVEGLSVRMTRQHRKDGRACQPSVTQNELLPNHKFVLLGCRALTVTGRVMQK